MAAGCLHISMERIRAATNDFNEDRFLGEGGFGRVYRGLDEVTQGEWAVKRAIRIAQKEACREEVKLVSGFSHPNILRLIGFSNEDEEQILVYEFAANGSLRDKLEGEARKLLTLEQRLDIAVGVARALKYLHKEAGPFEVVHLDVKPDNILLSRDMKALLADFGGSMVLIPHLSQSQTRVNVVGYTEEESLRKGDISAACDIYSFGVVLLELVTGEPAVIEKDTSRLLLGVGAGQKLHLAGWARKQGDPSEAEGVWDPALAPCHERCLQRLFELGIRCVGLDRTVRPNILRVLEDLESLVKEVKSVDLPSPPPRPVMGVDKLDVEASTPNCTAQSTPPNRDSHTKNRRAHAEEPMPATASREAVAGPSDTPRSADSLAVTPFSQRRLAEVEELERRALHARAAALGATHPDTLQSLKGPAAKLYKQGRLREAEELQRRALAGREAAQGAAHPDTLRSMHELAVTLQAQGRLADGEELMGRTLAGQEAALGAAHPDTLESADTLAATLHGQGRLAEAKELEHRSLAGAEAALRAVHPDTLHSVHALAVILRRQGRLAEAEELHRRALATQEAALGAAHLDTLRSVESLGTFLQGQARLAEAEELHRRALASREAALGAAHADTLQSVHDVAVTLHGQGRLTEAEELNRRALAGRELALGAAHPDTLRSMRQSALTLHEQGRLTEARELYRRALAGRESALGATHPDTLQSLDNLADTLHAQGHLTKAEELKERALAGREAMLGVAHPDTLRSMRSLAVTMHEQGRLAKAEELHRRAMAGQEAALGGAALPDTRRSLDQPGSYVASTGASS